MATALTPEQVTILGCGTSTGVPLLQCRCAVCTSSDPRNHRLRASIYVEIAGKKILIDTSTDLRQQALRHDLSRVDAILFTHPHADHSAGIDEIRSFNFLQREKIPAYGNEWTVRELTTRYPYLFAPTEPAQGGGVAGIDLHLIDAATDSLDILGLTVVPVSVSHGREEVVGYRFGRFAYLTDCSSIPLKSRERLMNLDVLVLDCLRLAQHGTHFNLEQALEVVSELRPGRTVLTHLGHDFEYVEWTRQGPGAKLPESVTLAFDGMVIRGTQLSGSREELK